jgi:hypothetical protein
MKAEGSCKRGSQSIWLLFVAVLLCVATGVTHAAGETDIVVMHLSGSVAVTRDGQRVDVRTGGRLVLPVAIRTGADGALELRQSRTTVTISANSTLNIPATGLASGKIDRIEQSTGSVFYRVEKRETQKLRVETPYVVAVIKGTQFNVVSQQDSSTVALFEGLLQIAAADGTDIVALNAGEIAVRYGSESRIRVLNMSTGQTLRAAVTPQGGNVQGTAAGTIGTAAPAPNRIVPVAVVPPVRGIAGSLPSVGVTAGVNVGSGSVQLGANVAAGLGNGTLGNSALGANVSVDANVGTNTIGANLATNVGGTSLGAGINLGGGSLDAGVNVGLGTAGAPSAPIGATLSLGTTPEGAQVGTSVNLGNTNLGVAVNLGGTLSSATNTVTAPLGSLVPDLTSSLSAPTTTATNVSSPALNTPTLTTPTLSAPAIITPAISTPVISTPTVSTPVLNVPALSLPSLSVPAVSLPTPTAPASTAPSLGGVLGGLKPLLGPN